MDWSPVFLIDQFYRGKLAATLRRPLAASLCGSLVAWAMMLPSFFVYTPGRPLEALNYAWPLYLAAFLPILAQGFLSGLVVEIINARWPHLRRRKIVAQDPAWNRTLSRRLLVPFIAFTLIVMVLLLGGGQCRGAAPGYDTGHHSDVTRRAAASSDIEDFLRSGQSLLSRDCRGAGAADRQRAIAVHAVIDGHAAGTVLRSNCCCSMPVDNWRVTLRWINARRPRWKSRRWCSTPCKPARRSAVKCTASINRLICRSSCRSARGRGRCWAA